MNCPIVCIRDHVVAYNGADSVQYNVIQWRLDSWTRVAAMLQCCNASEAYCMDRLIEID
jgi:hypothetical protein